MSFDDRITRFAWRFLTDRTFRLVVAPAVADLQFEDSAHLWRRTANRLAVLKAVAGGMRDDLARVSSGMFLLTLLPACYYIFLLVFCFDVFSITIATDFIIAALLILVLSFAPVMVCFWPERQPVRPVD
jgi:hypothetical protein